ncbi:MAG: hypothetical protein HYU35_01520 [Parcubacteria group bacterium]|nr:hypothetical protein [Parcubacteria group bacterium]
MKSARRTKTEYYSKEILKFLLIAGTITIAASSPSFIAALLKEGKRALKQKPQNTKRSLTYLRKRGFVETRRIGHDIEILLTEEGKKWAGKYQINDLAIPRPDRWDGRWRVVVFDISTESNFIRNVFRHKLKELGFHALQKSVWVYPFPCAREIELLRKFLGADKDQIQVMEVIKMENDRFLRKSFDL